MQYSDNEIKDIVLEYIRDSRSNQAILIDGEWGSGKTYFAQKVLIPAIKETFGKDDKGLVVYVSLYGVESAKQLSDEIYSSVASAMFARMTGSREASVTKVTNIASKLLTTGASIFFDTQNLPKYSDFTSLDNIVLIIDDLERCQLHINTVFGFLNNLVEHNEARMILIANQSEIGKNDISQDLPLKYSVVLHENYSKENEQVNSPLSTRTPSSQSTHNKSLNAQELQQHTEILFSNDVLYESLKEKLIGFTVKYQTDYESCFDTIVKNSVQCQAVCAFILANKEIIIEQFVNENHNNLRTLIFSITVYERLFSAIHALRLDADALSYVLTTLLLYTVTAAIVVKRGEPLGNNVASSHWSTLKMRAMLSLDEIICRLINDYIVYRLIDDAKLKSAVIALVSEKTKMTQDAAESQSWHINKLYEWWLLEDNERNTVLDAVYTELKEKKYPYSYYMKIAVLLIQMEHWGINVDVSPYILAMLENVNSEGEQIAPELFEAHGDEALVTRIDVLFAPIVNLIRSKTKSSIAQKVNECFEPIIGWGERFEEFCTLNKEQIRIECHFFSVIDIDVLFDRIVKSEVRSVYALIKGIKSIYSFSNLYGFFTCDLLPVQTLIEKVSGMNSQGDAKRIAITQLLVLLKEKEKDLTPR